ncbi:biotin transporter BioY [Listeria costaricensis]|uniref:biotin transporter BioY n=1 Tax=Listeria costaricensis TaxID=2026604 RepID=UPI000C079A9E|nr:biotin transporter BioY [Listeria costaricensis]
MQNQKLKFLIVDALFAVIIAILAQIAFPLGPIPFTGQTFAVGLAATILGARHATISVSVYILLGAFGIPVFQGMTAGLGIILGITGGFIIGFLFNALTTGWMLDRFGYKMWNAILANIIGAMVTLVFGVLWLKISTGMSLTDALMTGMIPFLIPGILKAVLAAVIGLKIRDRLVKSRLLPEKMPS